MPKDELPPEPDWFAAGTPDPWRAATPWTEITVAAGRRDLQIAWARTRLVGEPIPAADLSLWRRRCQAVNEDAPHAVWTGHDLINAVWTGISMEAAVVQLRNAVSVSEAAPISWDDAWLLYFLALYDGAAQQGADGVTLLTKAYAQLVLSKPAEQELARRVEDRSPSGRLRALGIHAAFAAVAYLSRRRTQRKRQALEGRLASLVTTDVSDAIGRERAQLLADIALVEAEEHKQQPSEVSLVGALAEWFGISREGIDAVLNQIGIPDSSGPARIIERQAIKRTGRSMRDHPRAAGDEAQEPFSRPLLDSSLPAVLGAFVEDLIQRYAPEDEAKDSLNPLHLLACAVDGRLDKLVFRVLDRLRYGASTAILSDMVSLADLAEQDDSAQLSADELATAATLLDLLPEMDRTLYVRHHGGRDTKTDLAREFGVTPQAMKQRLDRIQQRIDKLIRDAEEGV
jgi:hypothetical protein